MAYAAAPISRDARRTSEARHFRGQIGLRIPDVGLALDALYDPRLDHLVPGYKALSVVLANASSQKIFLSPKKDHWKIEDVEGVGRPATHALKQSRKAIWNELSADLQTRLDYPRVINPGAQVNVTLFFKDKTELADFRSISFYSSYLKKTLSYYSEGIAWQEKEVE